MSDYPITSIAPLLAVTTLSLVVLLIDALVKKSEEVSYWVTLTGLLFAISISLGTMPITGTAFNNMITFGGYGNFFSAVFLLAALLTVVFSHDYLQKLRINFGEFYLLVLFATLGMMLIASAAALIIIFLVIE